MPFGPGTYQEEGDFTDVDLIEMADADVFAALAENPDNEELLHRAGNLAVHEAAHWWDERSAFREDRRQNRNYFASKQWGESMTDPRTNEATTEKAFIESQGRIAFQMNLISNVVNNIEGQFRQNKSERLAFAVEREDEEAARMMNLARRASRRYNDSPIIEADQFIEHVISGASCFKSSYQYDPILSRYELKDSEVDQARLFYNLDLHDRRFNGLRIIGEVHDTTMQDLTANFARSRGEASRLKHLYAREADPSELIFTGQAGFDVIDGLDFRSPNSRGMVRVIEIWKPVYQWVRTGLDPLFADIPEGFGQIKIPENELARIQNARREQGLPTMELDEPRLIPMWHVFYCTPHGQIIHHTPTPYRHGSHPYAPGLARLIDGETWGLVSPLRDPQRWMNRLLSQIDHMMGAGAKGATAYDKEFLDDTDLKQQDVDQWYTSMNQSLGITVPQGKKLDDFVKQYQSREISAGYFDLIPLLMNFMDQISGVGEAMRGLEPKSGTSGALYQQQIIQAATNVLGYMQTYFEGLRRKDKKELQVIQQILTDPREIADNGMREAVMIDPERIRDIDWDIAMGDVADTATYRQLWEQDLVGFMQAGLIPFDVYLQASSHPRAEFLLRLLQNNLAGQGIPPEMQGIAMQAMQNQPTQPGQ